MDQHMVIPPLVHSCWISAVILQINILLTFHKPLESIILKLISHMYLQQSKVNTEKLNTRFFYEERFFSTRSQCWIKLQMFLRCYLIYITIIVVRYFLYLIYLPPYVGLDQFMLYLCNPFFFFSLIFIAINHTLFKQMCFLFVHFLEYLLLFLNNSVDEEIK